MISPCFPVNKTRSRLFVLISLALIIAFSFIISACGTTEKLNNNVPDVSIAFGTDATFDLATWNLKEFPYNGNATLDHLANLIPQLKLELIAFQEINNYAPMEALDLMLPDYAAYIYDATSSYRLAYIYDQRSVSVTSVYTIFNDESNPFPRPPFVMQLSWRGQEIYVINNHLKAYGDNIIDPNDDWDEERRRQLACEMLESYIAENLSDKQVIVVGDFNDEIQEAPESNVFTAFLDKEDEYLFTTMSIAQNISFSNASYPSWPSHIDHILITNELFAPFEASGSYCRTIIIENAMGSWQNYSANVSDHRPVGLRLKFD